MNIEITDAARASARNAGIYGDLHARLGRMLKRSAITTSEYGNRRFRDFVLDVSDCVVRDVTRIDFRPQAS